MARAVVPPMTSRQAKRAGKKQTAQFQYTASQMKRADRREELDQRRQDLEDKESKRKSNKRKREDQEAKEREVQRKLLSEGKISLEDTWAEVTASQPRLNSFFTKKALWSPKRPSPPRPLKESSNVENKANGFAVKEEQLDQDDLGDDAVFDSEEDTLVEKANVPNEAAVPMFQEFSEADLLQLFSSQPGQLTPSQKPLPTRSQQDRSRLNSASSPCHDLPNTSNAKMSRGTPSQINDEPIKSPRKTPAKRTKPDLQANSNPTTPTTNAPEMTASPTRRNSFVLPSTESTTPPEDEAILAQIPGPITADDEDDSTAPNNDPNAIARQVCSTTPSPESASRRRCLQQAHLQPRTSSKTGDEPFGDDGLDDETMAALASSAERNARERDPEIETEEEGAAAAAGTGTAPFSSSLPDSEMLLAVEAAEEGKKGGK